VQLSELQKLSDLDLDLGWEVEVILMRISGRGLPTHQIRSKLEKLFVHGRKYVSTYVGLTWVPVGLLGRRSAMT